ncbi:MAG: 6-phosphogluconolactonase [Clostridia bacterium]|nr:6-phosphogluconolactonase [Clostridia bacterium]
MGANAAKEAAEAIKAVIAARGEANIVFAAAPSQNEFLAHLLQDPTIEWEKVNGLHMDEYIGLPEGDEHSFGQYLYQHVFRHKSFKSVHYIHGWEKEKACEEYAQTLKDFAPDIVCMGIGENGHIAFNDPWVADFNDEKLVKVVPLDEVCRNQQVNDGCFKTIDEVPTHAVTLTLPALCSAKRIFCVVPAPTKANAVKNTVYGDITPDCPASILRTHPSAILYCDKDSGKYLNE